MIQEKPHTVTKWANHSIKFFFRLSSPINKPKLNCISELLQTANIHFSNLGVQSIDFYNKHDLFHDIEE